MIEEKAQKSQKPTSVSTSIIFELITCKVSKSVQLIRNCTNFIKIREFHFYFHIF